MWRQRSRERGTWVRGRSQQSGQEEGGGFVRGSCGDRRREEEEGEASACMPGTARVGTGVEAVETVGSSGEKRGQREGRKRAGKGMKTAKRTGTGRIIDGNRKKGEERNRV